MSGQRKGAPGPTIGRAESRLLWGEMDPATRWKFRGMAWIKGDVDLDSLRMRDEILLFMRATGLGQTDLGRICVPVQNETLINNWKQGVWGSSEPKRRIVSAAMRSYLDGHPAAYLRLEAMRRRAGPIRAVDVPAADAPAPVPVELLGSIEKYEYGLSELTCRAMEEHLLDGIGRVVIDLSGGRGDIVVTGLVPARPRRRPRQRTVRRAVRSISEIQRHVGARVVINNWNIG